MNNKILFVIINAIQGIILGIEVLKMSNGEFNAMKYTLSKGIPA